MGTLHWGGGVGGVPAKPGSYMYIFAHTMIIMNLYIYIYIVHKCKCMYTNNMYVRMYVCTYVRMYVCT